MVSIPICPKIDHIALCALDICLAFVRLAAPPISTLLAITEGTITADESRIKVWNGSLDAGLLSSHHWSALLSQGRFNLSPAAPSKSKVKTPGINLTRIESLLNVSKNKWYHSSVNIANKLFEDIGTISAATHQKISPVGIDLFYVRGDKSSQTVMKDIATKLAG